jgi:integrase/recombinase XerD
MREALKAWISEKQARGDWNPSSVRTMFACARIFMRFFDRNYPNISLNELTAKHLDHYRQTRFPPLANATQRKEQSALRSFFSWCIQHGLILASPIAHWKNLQATHPARPVLSSEQIETIFSAIDISTPMGISMRTIAELLYASAIRRSELTALDQADVDTVAARLWIHHGKGNKGRIVPLIPSACHWIRRYLKDARPFLLQDPHNEALFLNQKGKRIAGWGIEQYFNRLSKKIHIYFTPHVLRHTCATHLMQSGVPLPYIQIFLGHSFISTTQRYLHLDSWECQKGYRLAHPRDKWEINR